MADAGEAAGATPEEEAGGAEEAAGEELLILVLKPDGCARKYVVLPVSLTMTPPPGPNVWLGAAPAAWLLAAILVAATAL